VESPVDIRADVQEIKNPGAHIKLALLVPYTYSVREVSRGGFGRVKFGRGGNGRGTTPSPATSG
jgi:hypothetical protein